MPAAGYATRMFGVPKPLLPSPHGVLIDIMTDRLLGSCVHLFTGTRSGLYGMLSGRLANDRHSVYLANTATMAQTVLMAQKFTGDQDVALGMPDTWFNDDQAFIKLAAALDDGADVAVGVFRAQPGQHRKGGMCRTEGDQVVEVIDKPEVCAWPFIWGALAWKPIMWPLLDPADSHVGYALPRAIRRGLDVRAVLLDGVYWDCGTPDDYFDCIAAQRGPVQEAITAEVTEAETIEVSITEEQLTIEVQAWP